MFIGGAHTVVADFKMPAWLLPTLTLTYLTLGSSLWPTLRPISAWDRPPAVRTRSPAVMLVDQHMVLPAYSQRRRRVCEPPLCSSSAAASSDAAREEESWPAELSVEPLRSHPNQPPTAPPSGDREAFMFAKALPEGTILRGMQKGDVEGVVALAFTEYYEGPTEFSAGVMEGFGVLKSTWQRALANGKFEDADVGQLTDWLEMIWLRVMIRWGFGMRLSIGKRGQDHRVFCVADEEREDRDGLNLPLAAVAEISLQVPNGRTATPFPLPLWVKRLMAWPGPVLPYISNVLVHPRVRRQGYGNRLMLRCEEQARDWGYGQVYLHVDLTYYPAVRMYETMGYELVNDLEASFETPRLRYMKKIL